MGKVVKFEAPTPWSKGAEAAFSKIRISVYRDGGHWRTVWSLIQDRFVTTIDQLVLIRRELERPFYSGRVWLLEIPQGHDTGFGISVHSSDRIVINFGGLEEEIASFSAAIELVEAAMKGDVNLKVTFAGSRPIKFELIRSVSAQTILATGSFSWRDIFAKRRHIVLSNVALG